PVHHTTAVPVGNHRVGTELAFQTILLEIHQEKGFTKRDDIIKMILWFLTAKKRILSGNSYE
ncbi:hypothetical protein KSY29_19140, partial [Phocaeicola vulgatus]